MERRTRAEEANIKTATVTINQIQVNGRKMTLSVFRQIMRESIIDDNHSLKGIPWGQVNYFWKENEGDVHVLWQRDNELRRCPLTKGDEVTSKISDAAASLRRHELSIMTDKSYLIDEKLSLLALVKLSTEHVTFYKDGRVDFEFDMKRMARWEIEEYTDEVNNNTECFRS